MEELRNKAEAILKSQCANEGLEISEKENGREGVDFLVESKNGNQNELFLQPMDLLKQMSTKVPKEKLGQPRENLWVALVGIIAEKEPLVILIPSKTLANPDDYVFFENIVGQHKYLSNWEIKVFSKGMEKLGEFIFHNQIENFK